MEKNIFASILLFVNLLAGVVFASPEEEIKEDIKHCRQFINETLDSSRSLTQRELFQYVPICIVCTQPEITSELENHEKSKIHNFAKKIEEAKQSLSPDELANVEKLEAYTIAKWEKSIGKARIYSGDELASLDLHLRSIWQRMRTALQGKDVDRAVSYFGRKTREDYRKLFASLGDALPDMAKDLSDIQLIEMKSPYSVEYDLRSIRKGKTYSYILIFIKDRDGQWRILKF